MVTCFGSLATISCELRQVRKEATVAVISGAEVRLGQVTTHNSNVAGRFLQSPVSRKSNAINPVYPANQFFVRLRQIKKSSHKGRFRAVSNRLMVRVSFHFPGFGFEAV
jgi:hypothetical protein